ncbi:hypothetical protein CDL15_Pgr009405 [Punica granatum]|uniref:Uncharacterized protein n=1 Tax=Punica granatum TaxID=22663 RepID=A0A218WXU7_PUNGR|nr:hypothetical protein CDL15_Pgr009405 [Punica granatum]
MHVRGARCTGRAAGVHRRRAGARGAQLACAGARLCARLDAREAHGRTGRATGVRGRVGRAAVRSGALLCARVRVMINNGSAFNVCPVSTLKQMNVDMSRIRASKTTVRAIDGSRREVNGEIDLLIDMGVSTPFWSTGSDRGLLTIARDTIHDRKTGGKCESIES